MIGWGWVISTGNWITQSGVVGAALGFVIGGIMIFFIGRTYAELISAMPKCGGEHVYSYKALGPFGSFICTWAIVLGYVSVVCFESCTIPLVFSYLYPDFLQGYLYSIGGYDIYATWLISAIAVAAAITYINIRGVKMAARVQSAFTLIIAAVGILLIVAGVFFGDTSNLENQIFPPAEEKSTFNAILTAAMVTPFFFIGFDVIPQAAEEIKVSFKKVGRIMLMSIVLAVLFYVGVILSVGLIMDAAQIETSMGASGLVTADALALAFNSDIMSKVVLVGGLCGIITSWNAFLLGSSRAVYSMAESHMIPRTFAKLHKKYKTPVVAILFIGILSLLSPFLGRQMLVWIVDAGNLGCCLAYFLVALSFLRLRKTHPEMPRPYKVRHYKTVGTIALLMSGFMVVMYLIPGTGVTLAPIEWAIILGWTALGIILAAVSLKKYGHFDDPSVDVKPYNHVEEVKSK